MTAEGALYIPSENAQKRFAFSEGIYSAPSAVPHYRGLEILFKLLQIFLITISDLPQLLLDLRLTDIQPVTKIIQIPVIVAKLRIDIT